MGADLNYGFSRLTTERPKQRTTRFFLFSS